MQPALLVRLVLGWLCNGPVGHRKTQRASTAAFVIPGTPHHVEVAVSRRTFAKNIRYIKALCEPAKLCVVMKANAYGHGLRELAATAVTAGAHCLGICTNPEATAIRAQSPDIPILRLRMGLPDEYEESLASLGIEEQVGSLEAADFLSTAGQRRGNPVPVHINIDTGMGRSGFFPEQVEQIKRVCGLPGLRIAGIMTHLAQADAHRIDVTERHLDTYDSLLEELDEVLPDDALRHTHNSAATVRLTNRRRDMVRVGAACYGVRTSQDFDNPEALEPVMSVRTRVAQVRRIPRGRTIGYGSLYTTFRDSLIASLPVGFGEGYPRALFNKGIVLIHGQRCPVVGRVSLNITTVDVTDVPGDVAWGDEAVLIGRQGGEEVSFEEMADKFESVHTEINLMAGSMNARSYPA